MRDPHLSEEDLALVQSGPAPARAAAHLEWCAECKNRLADLDTALAAFAQYRNAVRDPELPAAPKPWRSLVALHQQSEPPRSPWRWWQIPGFAAAVCLAVAAVVVWRHPAAPAVPQATQLLTQSASAGRSPHRTLALRQHGRTLLRPAVLVPGRASARDAEMTRLAGLFTQARYNWQEPLSAHSFGGWRDTLSAKRDRVTVIRPGTPSQAYRVQTETDAGVLRSAALTLTGPDLHPASGTFEFAGEPSLEMDETDAPADESPTLPAPKPVAPPAEIAASPADTLRVLAALHRIGADAGDPIEVSVDGRSQVLVSATGLSAERRRQVSDALQGLPHARLDLDAAPVSQQPVVRQAAPERNSTGMPAALRKRFEEALGGPIPLQEVTDRVLESSGSAVAAAHALEVLTSTFPPAAEATLSPPDRELLRTLRLDHLSSLRTRIEHIRADLRPLLPAVSAAPAERLWPAVQQLDATVNHLLAGSYTQAEGEALLHTLAQQLHSVDLRLAGELK